MNSATFTVGPDDLTAANRLHFIKLVSLRRWLLTFILSAVAIALVFYGVDLSIDIAGYLIALASMWGMIVTICVLGWLMIPRQARRTWKQAQRLWIETSVHWDPDGITFRSAGGESRVQWSAYHRWAPDDRSILLYQDERSFYTLPIRDFPADAREEIIGYLKGAGVPQR